MADIFLSYSRKDSEFCDLLSVELEKLYEVWIDLSDVKGGTEWVMAIERGIKEAKVFLVVISNHGNESVWVRRETQYALKCNRYIIPLLLNDQLPITLIDKQYIDFQSTFEGGFRDLLEVLKQFLESEDRTGNETRRLIGDGILSYLWGDLEKANLSISKALTLSPSIGNGINHFWELLTESIVNNYDDDNLARKFHSLLRFSERTIRSGHYDEGPAMYEWTVWLDVRDEILRSVEYVKYILHETFPQPIQIVRNRDQMFSLTRHGWGTFKIKAEVFFVDGSVCQTSYDLTFRLKI